MKKIGILSAYRIYNSIKKIKYNALRIKEELEKIGLECEFINKDDVKIEFKNNNYEILYNEISLSQLDFLFIQTSFTREIKWGYTLINYLLEKDIKFINYDHYIKFVNNFNKLDQLTIFSKNSISYPQTYIFNNVNEIKNFTSKKQRKFIIKPIYGHEGKDVYILNTKNINLMLEKYTVDNIIVQKKLPNKIDFRIMIVGGKPLGIMKKESKDKSSESITTNFSGGNIVLNYDNSQSDFDLLCSTALRASQILKCTDYCGVDLMYDENGIINVLEVNRSAYFEGFEKVTKINVAKEIVEFIVNY